MENNQSSLNQSLPDKSRYPIFNVTEWPQELISMFAYRNNQEVSLEERLCGPINTLLSWAFGPGVFAYVVSPETPPNDIARAFVVYETKTVQPMLIVEINNNLDVDIASRRLEADVNIRTRFMDIMPKSPLFGLCMLGTATRLYHSDIQTRNVTPVFVQPPVDTILPADFLADGWGVDVLSTEGLRLMKDIVEDILMYSDLEGLRKN